jgi:membrane protein YqaA with SNARE-associated domain
MELEGLGLVGLFIASFLSATLLPFSSEVILILFLSQGFSPFLVFFAATLGNGLGGTFNYFIGFYIQKAKWFSRIYTLEKLQKFKKWIDSSGSFLAFFSWVPFVGDPLLVAMGFLNSPKFATLFWMWAGKLVRYLVVILLYLYFR